MQIPLPIDLTSRSDQRAVILGEANREALEILTQPQHWPSHCMILAGPRRSGRSSIAVAVQAMGAIRVIDDADQSAEAALFHNWNAAREEGQPLLLIAEAPPPIWAIALPDLRSRRDRAYPCP
jgi:chloramphenicol 3-O-phosphotransferase